MHLRKLIVAAACAALTLPGVALAQPGGHGGSTGHGGVGHGGMSRGGPPGGFGGHFAAGPVGHFGARDLATWRAGYWWHGWRGGRVGWWWFAGGFWYWFAAPVYPYPGYVPDDYVGGGYPAPGAVAWWCDDPPGYYPYVRGCWRWRPAPPTYGSGFPP
jgi:hypothetical protein